MPTQKDNARCNRAAPIFNPHGSGGYTPTPKNHETNPIYPSQQPIANSQKLLFTKRTQSHPQRTHGRPKNTKRTQFPSQAGNLPYGHAMPCPKNTKRTQFTPPPAWPTIQICRSEAQIRPWRTKRTQFTTAADLWKPKNTKRTQFPPRPPIYEPPTTNYEPNMRNEPNYRLVNSRNEPNSSPFQVHHAGQRPVKVYPGAPGMHIGKPNSPPQPLNPRQKYETNPIYPTIYKPPSTIHNIQYTIPRPNSQTPKQRLTLYA